MEEKFKEIKKSVIKLKSNKEIKKECQTKKVKNLLIKTKNLMSRLKRKHGKK